jgi:outer membrane autotransporter protein
LSGDGVTRANAVTFGIGTNAFELQAGATITGNVVDQTGDGTFRLGGAANGSFAVSNIGPAAQYQGFASFVKTGTSTWTLTGTTAQVTPWTINQGALAISADANLGAPTGALTFNGGALEFLASFNLATTRAITLNAGGGTFDTNGFDTTVAQGITGAGGLTKAGAGTLTLTGTSTYAGATEVDAGTLAVNGALNGTSAVDVNGGILTGIGTITSALVTVGSGGTFAPGNATPGSSITIVGNLAFQSGAMYLVMLNPTTASFANVSGTASLAGIVQAAFAPGSYMQRQYTILHSGGLSGTFDSLVTTGLPAGFIAALSYTGTDALLNLVMGLGKGVGLSQNQQNVANAINNFFNNGGMLPPNFVSLAGLSGGNLAFALSQLSGEVATGGQQAAFQTMTQFLGLMLDPFVNGRGLGGGATVMGFAPEQQAANLPPDVARAYAAALKAPPRPATDFERRWSVWGTGFGAGNRTDGDAVVIGSHDLTARDYGFAGGMDYHAANVVAGFALSGAGTNWSLNDGLGSGRSDAFQAGLYAKAGFGAAYLAGAVAFANHWMSTDRFAFAGDHLTASFDAQVFGGRLEAGYRYGWAGFGVTPYAALQAQQFHTPNYSEIDLTGGGFALSYAARDAHDVRGELGARFDSVHLVNGMPLVLRARAAWAHDWVSDPSLLALFQALPGASFIVTGATPAKDSALASAGAEWHLTPQLSLAAKFDGEFASGSQTYGGTGTVRYTW